ncbi:hypothetical protein QQM79_19700 [Marinobacteraceae bacterium S3BR75-40.1]
MDKKVAPSAKAGGVMLAFSLLLAACGGGSDSGSGTKVEDQGTGSGTALQTGVLIDSEVINAAYRTDSQSARTNEKGEFRYQSGEMIVFSVGGIELPPTPAKKVITLLDIVGTDDPDDTSVVNMARMFQTLDSDGDPDNGIVIDEMAHTAASGVDPNSIIFGDENFGDNLVNVWANAGSTNTTLISAEQASEHLRKSLQETSADFDDLELAGNTFYDAYTEEGTWALDVFEFDAEGNGMRADGEPGTYSVTDGVLFTSTSWGDIYVQILRELEANHWEVCWSENSNEGSECSGGDIEHLFTTKAAAQVFVDSKNSEPALTWQPTDFTSGKVYNVRIPDFGPCDGQLAYMEFTFNANGTVNGFDPCDGSSPAGTYAFVENNEVMKVNIDGGDNTMYVVPTSAVSNNSQGYCWLDDESVTSATQAIDVCGGADDSEVSVIMTGTFHFDLPEQCGMQNSKPLCQ